MYWLTVIIGMVGVPTAWNYEVHKFTLILDSQCYLHYSWKGIRMFYLVATILSPKEDNIYS